MKEVEVLCRGELLGKLENSNDRNLLNAVIKKIYVNGGF
ncbi:hypothetical protein DSOL_3783 [Desulfosporosinus metallidurans]|uniref:Uncharacterized protein n=1 Tax=Desulfosporosinus metallidurans TaxID=1888891 RepID=A0A1Q8QNU7_9FIRM|nr:hypothetical protein DSOL_3783 [Desulfosporosinus metallidurans]